MADTDNRARQLDVVDGFNTIDKEIPGGTVKADPIGKNRLPEDASRADYYAGAGQKNTLPEHQVRRTALPHITVSSA